jgi:hypothetical protein
MRRAIQTRRPAANKATVPIMICACLEITGASMPITRWAMLFTSKDAPIPLGANR